jgi:hypothetical protein
MKRTEGLRAGYRPFLAGIGAVNAEQTEADEDPASIDFVLANSPCVCYQKNRMCLDEAAN